jgi:hypothetical protein
MDYWEIHISLHAAKSNMYFLVLNWFLSCIQWYHQKCPQLLATPSDIFCWISFRQHLSVEDLLDLALSPLSSIFSLGNPIPHSKMANINYMLTLPKLVCSTNLFVEIQTASWHFHLSFWLSGLMSQTLWSIPQLSWYYQTKPCSFPSVLS